MIPVIAWLTYFAFLSLLLVVIAATKAGSGMFRTIIVIAFNAILANAYTWQTKDSDPWWLFMVLDVTAATIILIQPAARMQALIGWTYMAQLAMHAAYGMLGAKADPMTYWWLLTSVAYLQLLLVGGWWASVQWPDLARIPWLRPLVASAHRTGVET